VQLLKADMNKDWIPNGNSAIHYGISKIVRY